MPAYEGGVYDNAETTLDDKHIETAVDTSILQHIKTVTFDSSIKDPIHNSTAKSTETFLNRRKNTKHLQVKFPAYQKIPRAGVRRFSRLAQKERNMKGSVMYGTFVFLAMAFSVVTSLFNNQSY